MSETDADYDCGFLADVVDEGRVSFEPSRREQYAGDAGPHDPSVPDAVVWPADAAEVSRVLAAANERGVPVTPWSGGSSLEGNPVPVEGGVVLTTYEMDGVTVEADDLQAVVGPGVVYDDLNEVLAGDGLRFPPGISSGDVATVGGMIANNASGFNAVRYGETRDHVRRLEAVLPDGRIVECGRGVVKTSAGYSLKDLFVGSEGTLGVVTEATLAVEGIPERRRAALVAFPTGRDASSAVSEVIRFGVRPGAIEYLSAPAVSILDEYDPGLGLDVAPTLIVELHANNSGIEDDVEFVRGICEDNGATEWSEAAESERDEIWRVRREAYTAIRNHRKELEGVVVGDVVVPVSRYPDVVEAVETESAALDLLCPAVGHAGDGNLHYTPLVDPDDEEAVERAFELNDRIVTRAIEMGGTATGEHGVGVGKRKFMEKEHGAALGLMRDIKRTFDPNGIMNPGKVIPDPPESG